MIARDTLAQMQRLEESGTELTDPRMIALGNEFVRSLSVDLVSLLAFKRQFFESWARAPRDELEYDVTLDGLISRLPTSEFERASDQEKIDFLLLLFDTSELVNDNDYYAHHGFLFREDSFRLLVHQSGNGQIQFLYKNRALVAQWLRRLDQDFPELADTFVANVFRPDNLEQNICRVISTIMKAAARFLTRRDHWNWENKDSIIQLLILYSVSLHRFRQVYEMLTRQFPKTPVIECSYLVTWDYKKQSLDEQAIVMFLVEITNNLLKSPKQIFQNDRVPEVLRDKADMLRFCFNDEYISQVMRTNILYNLQRGSLSNKKSIIRHMDKFGFVLELSSPDKVYDWVSFHCLASLQGYDRIMDEIDPDRWSLQQVRQHPRLLMAFKRGLFAQLQQQQRFNNAGINTFIWLKNVKSGADNEDDVVGEIKVLLTDAFLPFRQNSRLASKVKEFSRETLNEDLVLSQNLEVEWYSTRKNAYEVLQQVLEIQNTNEIMLQIGISRQAIRLRNIIQLVYDSIRDELFASWFNQQIQNPSRIFSLQELESNDSLFESDDTHDDAVIQYFLYFRLTTYQKSVFSFWLRYPVARQLLVECATMTKKYEAALLHVFGRPDQFGKDFMESVANAVLTDPEASQELIEIAQQFTQVDVFQLQIQMRDVDKVRILAQNKAQQACENKSIEEFRAIFDKILELANLTSESRVYTYHELMSEDTFPSGSERFSAFCQLFMYNVLNAFKKIQGPAEQIVQAVIQTPIGPRIVENSFDAFAQLHRIIFLIEYISSIGVQLFVKQVYAFFKRMMMFLVQAINRNRSLKQIDTIQKAVKALFQTRTLALLQRGLMQDLERSDGTPIWLLSFFSYFEHLSDAEGQQPYEQLVVAFLVALKQQLPDLFAELREALIQHIRSAYPITEFCHFTVRDTVFSLVDLIASSLQTIDDLNNVYRRKMHSLSTSIGEYGSLKSFLAFDQAFNRLKALQGRPTQESDVQSRQDVLKNLVSLSPTYVHYMSGDMCAARAQIQLYYLVLDSMQELTDNTQEIIKHILAQPLGPLIIDQACLHRGCQFLKKDASFFMFLQQQGVQVVNDEVVRAMLYKTDAMPTIRFLMQFGSWNPEALVTSFFERVNPDEFDNTHGILQTLFSMIVEIRPGSLTAIRNVMSNEGLRNKWFGFIDLDALDGIAAGQQAARDVEIKAKALEIAEALLPDARAVDSVESSSEALNTLPAYIEKKSIRPGRSVLELAVDPTGQMDMDEREYLALKLARVYPYKLDAQNLEWISAQLEASATADPLTRVQEAIDRFVAAQRAEMYTGDLIVNLETPEYCQVCMGETTRVVRPFCFNTHSDSNVCVSCQRDAAIYHIDKEGKPAECNAEGCHSILTQATVEELMEPGSTESDEETKERERLLKLNRDHVGRQELIEEKCPICRDPTARVQLGHVQNGYCQNPECMASFCRLCRKRAHNPFSCATWSSFVVAPEIPAEMAANIAKCPKCSYTQYRALGTCNHIVCGRSTHGETELRPGSCGFEYCIVCKQSWDLHTSGYFQCTQASESQQTRQNELLFQAMGVLEERQTAAKNFLLAGQVHLIRLGAMFFVSFNKYNAELNQEFGWYWGGGRKREIKKQQEVLRQKVEAERRLVDLCMQRASLKMQELLEKTAFESVQLEHQQLEMYLIEPECQRAIAELIDRRKLDFVMKDEAPDLLASKLSNLLNPHCVAYFLNKRDEFEMQILEPFVREALEIAGSVLEQQPSVRERVNVLKLTNKGPIVEELVDNNRLSGRSVYRVMQQVTKRYVQRQLLRCLDDVESQVRKGTLLKNLHK